MRSPTIIASILALCMLAFWCPAARAEQREEAEKAEPSEEAENSEEAVNTGPPPIDQGTQQTEDSEHAANNEQPTSDRATEDDQAIGEFDGFMARAYVSMPDLSLEIVDNEESSPSLMFSPNVSLSIGLGLSYGGFGAALSTTVPGTTEDESLYGSTDYFDFQVYYFDRKFGVDAYYQAYKGFSLEEPGAAGENCQRGDSCSIYPELGMGTIGLNGYYVLADDFSFPAAFNQSERQLRSGGSFLGMVSASRIVIDNEGEPLIPEAHASTYGDEAGLTAGTFYGLTILPGYAYTLVWRDFFVTPALFLGGGVQHRTLDLGSEEVEDLAAAFDLNLKVAAGYNGESVIGGLTAVLDQNAVSLERTELTVFVMTVEFFLGFKI